MNKYVYVLAPDGQPLMPTKRFGKVRHMLEDGHAVKVQSKPFTIRLTYEPKTRYVSDLYSGTDGGRTNIGDAVVDEIGHCLYSAKIITRNAEIPKLMADRKAHRQASRRGERLARKRLAERHHTNMRGGSVDRILPHYNKPVHVKGIINTESKFCHRVREPGWLTPTAKQLLQTLISLDDKVRKIMPVKYKVLEINKFAFMALEDPETCGKDFQNGPMKGFQTQLEAIQERQGGRCLLCGKTIENIHHLTPRSAGGSERLKNKSGICEECHDNLHKDTEARKGFDKEHPGEKKQFAGTSIWNQVFPFYLDAMIQRYGEKNVFLTNGWDTRDTRDVWHLEKDHDIDAYVIACSPLQKKRAQKTLDAPDGNSYTVLQYRRHDRQLIYSQHRRAYKVWVPGAPNGGKKGKWVAVAHNRHKATEQKDDSFEEWFDKKVKELGYKAAYAEAKKLRVVKSKRSYIDPKRVLCGAAYLKDGKTCVLAGTKRNGTEWRAYGEKDYIPKKQCTLLKLNSGLVYL